PQGLESMSPQLHQAYKRFLQWQCPGLSGNGLEQAIRELYEYRQKEGSNSDKAVVAPDKSDTQTLVGRSSHWSSSDTLLSSGEVQTENQDRKELERKLIKIFRSIVWDY